MGSGGCNPIYDRQTKKEEPTKQPAVRKTTLHIRKIILQGILINISMKEPSYGSVGPSRDYGDWPFQGRRGAEACMETMSRMPL
jgi:hypothetical protein